jgi:phosphoenolpyruvate-protein kinase (PTS system EI component)
MVSSWPARTGSLPAVVGVAGAPERITRGQQITVDGTAGAVRSEAAVPQKESFSAQPREEQPGKEVGADTSVVLLHLLHVVA